MKEKVILNKEALNIKDAEDFLGLYENLLPWEQERLSGLVGNNLSKCSDEEILQRFDINPVDHVDERDCYEAFGTSLLENFYDYELLNETESRMWRMHADTFVDFLDQKSKENEYSDYYFTDEDAVELEKILERVKEKLEEKKNNQSKKQ